MLEERKHDYRLSTQPAKFFVDALEQGLLSKPKITEVGDQFANVTARQRTVAYTLFDESVGPFYFDLVVEKERGTPDKQDLQLIRAVFYEVVTMDDAARTIPCQHDENEELFAVRIDPTNRMVVFEYSSTLWNTQWEVHFEIDEKGEFACLGMPDWKSPGDYII